MRRVRGIKMLLVMVVALALCACASFPWSRGPATDDTSPQVDAVVPISSLGSRVSREDAARYDFTEQALGYLTTIGERFPCRDLLDDQGQHDAFVDWLVSELVACGYPEDQIEEQRFEIEGVGGMQGRNIVLTVPGTSPVGQVVVGAHYDGSGIGDNGSGAALLLATAAGLVDETPQLTIKYVFFDGEEEGMLGSAHFAELMTPEEVAATAYMVNLDSLAFGDFCHVYGGVYGDDYGMGDIALVEGEPLGEPRQTEGYDFAADVAEDLGIEVLRTAQLDGLYEQRGQGMDVSEGEGLLLTNPWTDAHPAPENMVAPSPATIGASDHVPFAARGIPYIYFEATNWWAEGAYSYYAYTGYVETYDTSLGDGGMFMNTEFDTPEELERLFPGRAGEHYRLYSPLLSALLLVETT